MPLQRRMRGAKRARTPVRRGAQTRAAQRVPATLGGGTRTFRDFSVALEPTTVDARSFKRKKIRYILGATGIITKLSKAEN